MGELSLFLPLSSTSFSLRLSPGPVDCEVMCFTIPSRISRDRAGRAWTSVTRLFRPDGIRNARENIACVVEQGACLNG